MSDPSWKISRRHLLRGAGAVMGLPLLDAMMPPAACAAVARPRNGVPVRLACLFMANGVNQGTWFPNGKSLKDMPAGMKPLKDLRQHLTVISGIDNPGCRGHERGTAGWLSCVPVKKGNEIMGGKSMDQMVVDDIGRDTMFPSLVMGTERPGSGIGDQGFLRAYSSYISWKSPTEPIVPVINPKTAFYRLFGGRMRTKGSGDTFGFGPADGSVLDQVMNDADNLMRRIGREDQQRLYAYLDAVREIEIRVEKEGAFLAKGENLEPHVLAEVKQLHDRFTGKGVKSEYAFHKSFGELPRSNHTAQVRLMLDIIALAFWSDSSRVATFMFGNGVSGRNFSFLAGVNGGHHDISHHKNNADQLKMFTAINQWHAEQFAYLLTRMKNLPEAGGTLLDNTTVLLGSGLNDGNSHGNRNLPVVVGGHGGGAFKGGRYVRTDPGTPLSKLHMALARSTGAKPKKVAGSSTALKGLR